MIASAIVVAAAVSYALGWAVGIPLLVPVFNTLAAFPFMVAALSRGDVRLAVARMLVWALALGVCATLPALVLGWHPWAVIRIVSFVVIGVVLSAPLLSWLGGFRVDRRTARQLLAWAAVGLIADVALKWLLAPTWHRLLLRAAGW